MKIITSFVKQIQRERLKSQTKGVYIHQATFSVTAGVLNHIAIIDFSPIYFTSPPLISSTGVCVNILNWKKKGKAITGATLRLTGTFDYDTILTVSFEGQGGL